MNILTFDIEEWFHILDHGATKTEAEWSNYESRLDANMEKIFTLLDKHNQKATFFVLGWVARNYPHILKKIDELGHEIGSHSDRHQLVYEQSKKAFKDDLSNSIQCIEDTIGKKVTMYRAPGFSIREKESWVFETLMDNGIEIDCSVFPAHRAHGGFSSYEYVEPSLIVLPDGRLLKELPINLYNLFGKRVIFSGGGYFRLLPFSIISYMAKNSSYVMTYFHPRDFDGEQPVIKDLSLVRRFKSYYGLSNAYDKLDRLIANFDFYDIGTLNEQVDWDNANRYFLEKS